MLQFSSYCHSLREKMLPDPVAIFGTYFLQKLLLDNVECPGSHILRLPLTWAFCWLYAQAIVHGRRDELVPRIYGKSVRSYRLILGLYSVIVLVAACLGEVYYAQTPS